MTLWIINMEFDHYKSCFLMFSKKDLNVLFGVMNDVIWCYNCLLYHTAKDSKKIQAQWYQFSQSISIWLQFAMTDISIYAIQISSSFQVFVLLNFWTFFTFYFFRSTKEWLCTMSGKECDGRVISQRQSAFSHLASSFSKISSKR